MTTTNESIPSRVSLGRSREQRLLYVRTWRKPQNLEPYLIAIKDDI